MKRTFKSLLVTLFLLLVVGAAASCGSADVEPGGPVPKYKIFDAVDSGTKDKPSIDVRATSEASDPQTIQYAAQDIIIKQIKKHPRASTIIVGFYAGAGEGESPFGQMTWIRKDPGLLGTIGLGGNDPFDVGTWDWEFNETAASQKPALSIGDVEVTEGNSVRVEGTLMTKLKSIEYEVYEPNQQVIGKPLPVKLDSAKINFSAVWQPPAKYKPKAGVYVIRFATHNPDNTPGPEIWVKVDLQSRTWAPPAEVIEIPQAP